MATATDKPGGTKTIHVSDMPPLAVTTVGIPVHEHIPTHARPAVDHRARWGRSDAITWMVAGAVVLAFLVATAVLRILAPASPQMGTSAWSWSEYRAGERVATSVPAVAPVVPDSPFTGAPMTAVQPLGAIQPPYVG